MGFEHSPRIRPDVRNRLVTKSDVINAIAQKRQYVAYLELSTPISGHEFDKVTYPGLSIRHRFAYASQYRVDQQTATRRYEGFCLDAARLVRLCARYDIILVDSFHTYGCSMRDVLLARALLADGGTILVHDCNPPDEDFASPIYRDGAWPGATHAAFVDLMLNSNELEHCTIDLDVGLGIIRRCSSRPRESLEPLKQTWERSRVDEALRFQVFSTHRHQLLNLVSLERFVRDEGLEVDWLS
jgi:hypothetical protein